MVKLPFRRKPMPENFTYPEPLLDMGVLPPNWLGNVPGTQNGSGGGGGGGGLLGNVLSNNPGMNTMTPAQQQQYAAMVQQYAAGPHAPADYNRSVASVSPVIHKATVALRKLVDQLPLAVATKITSCTLQSTHNAATNKSVDWRFVVTFDGERTIEFAATDAFPDDADVSRIVLECP